MRLKLYFGVVVLVVLFFFVFFVRWNDYSLKKIDGLSAVSRLSRDETVYFWDYSFGDGIGFWVKVDADSIKKNTDGSIKKLVVEPLNTKIFTKRVSLLSPFRTNVVHFKLVEDWAKMGENIANLTENNAVDINKPVFVVLYGFGREKKMPNGLPCEDECEKSFFAMGQEHDNFYKLMDRSFKFRINKLAVFAEIVQ